ncbi:MAG TPA: serine/threonine-protein kinase [Arenimonas sp.]|uniref:serine/threonine-protein kinase n=1 Tax=Arenimonas sp. TaxID=1872635 RepID=UPI002C5D07F7|nr:serine/threonine-protein kinase [Arenimonas sp.]HMB56376.1 serine/threonine-protein kinase [Arenimonas sp.]
MIAGYRILHELGRGGMATVYRAVQESLGREIALKVMAPELARDPAYAERFLREGRVVARLRHRNIVTVHDLGLGSDGAPYMAMEFVPGGSVAARVGSLDAAAALRCMRDIADALDHAHRNGVIHRDIKPENILCHDDGSYLLSDFGVARLSEATSSLTAEGSTLGTPQYMSPEQWRGEELDGRTDLYALGVVFHQLLTGAAPYSGTDGWAIGMQHMTADIPRLPPSRAAFQPLLDALLAKQRDNRPADGAEVVRRVDELRSQLLAVPPAPPNAVPANVTTPLPAHAPTPTPTPLSPNPSPTPPPTPAAVKPVRIAPPPIATIQRATTAKSSNAALYWLLGLGLAFLLLMALAGVAYLTLKAAANNAEQSSNDYASSAPDNPSPPAAANGAAAPAGTDSGGTSGAVNHTAMDAGVAAALDLLGIKYSVDGNGDFRVVEPLQNGRRQQSWIRSRVENYAGVNVREIWSLAYRNPGAPLPAEISSQILNDPRNSAVGQWRMESDALAFVVRVPVNTNAYQLSQAIDAASRTADAMEQQLTGGGDQF